MEKEFKHKDFGEIDFGNVHKGKSWMDPSIKIDYLEYIISDKCLTSEENKETARQVLEQRRICDGQLEIDFNGSN